MVGYVYVMSGCNDGTTKIGKAKCVDRRFKQLSRVHSDLKIEHRHFHISPYWYEGRCHKRAEDLGYYRVRGQNGKPTDYFYIPPKQAVSLVSGWRGSMARVSKYLSLAVVLCSLALPALASKPVEIVGSFKNLPITNPKR